jgi:hypothetical protein
MAVESQPLFNPCSLKGGEQIPAKIWELLRRNDRFRAEVERLRKLDAQERAVKAHPGNSRGTAWDESWTLVKDAENCHPFAHPALLWLVPEPVFHANRDQDGSHEDGEGLSPDLSHPSWRWRVEDAICTEGGWSGRGPVILRLRGDIDTFAEWQGWEPAKGWQDGKRWFNCDTPWPQTPEGFRHAFQFLWRSRYDCRPDNPITHNRNDSPHPHEVSFFRDWKLTDFRLAGQGTGVTDGELGRVFEFEELADDYRVFAFPKSIPTRTAAREMANWLFKHLAEGLPPRERESFLGTPLQWDIFLAVQGAMLDGAPFQEALQFSFDQIFLDDATGENGKELPDQRRLWSQRGASWADDYRKMDSPLSDAGWVQRVYPSMAWAIETTPAQARP